MTGVQTCALPISADFSSCVYDHDYEDDFLDAWDDMLDKYDLKNNS